MSNALKQQKKYIQGGFSLIELLVSVSIFAVVVTIAAGTLLVIINANARAQNMQEVMTNLTFAIDSINREARTGAGFYCSDSTIPPILDYRTTQDCLTGGTNISIVEGGESLTRDSASKRISYRFNDSDGTLERRIGDGEWYALTSPNITLEEAVFYVRNAETALGDDDAQQPLVTIYLKGVANDIASTEATFELQTTVAKRILDI